MKYDIVKPAPTPGKTDWFQNDRFGLFIHWGTYTLAARHEWVKSHEKTSEKEYQEYFDHFDPDLYDPNVWAQEAKNAGMQYFVITTKHHEGFCLWDSEYTDYKATNTPYGKDLLTPMVDAFRAQDMKVGFYHSLLDWHHPHYSADMHHPRREDPEYLAKDAERDPEIYAEYLKNQTRELMTKFGKVDILWYDFSVQKSETFAGKGKEAWHSQELIDMIRGYQPDILINDRLQIDQDLKTPEQYQPPQWPTINGVPVVWEACQTLSGSWGYYRDEYTWKSVDMLIKMLIDSVSKGGNLLLNVGPTGRGEFDQRALDRLRGIGKWMRLHNRSIYGCTQAPEAFRCPEDCRYTYNPETNRLYLHIFSWPFKHIHLYDMADKVEYAQLLNDASQIKMSTYDGDDDADMISFGGNKNYLTLEVPIKPPVGTVPVIELYLK